MTPSERMAALYDMDDEPHDDEEAVEIFAAHCETMIETLGLAVTVAVLNGAAAEVYGRASRAKVH